MSSILINPNWHAVLIHFPVCLLLVGVAIELLTIVFRRPLLRTAGRWILVLGVLSAVAVAFAGIYALDDVVYRSQRPQASQASERPWRDLARDARLHGGPEIAYPSKARAEQQRTDEAWRMLKRHAWLEGSGTAILAIILICATALPGRLRHRLMVPLRLLLVVALGVILWGAWFSGETVYRDATATQLKGADEPRPGPPTQGGLAARIGYEVEYFLGPPLQTHVFFAGLTVAVALGALMSAMWRLKPASVETESGDEPAAERHGPVARFWLAATLIALVTGFLGVWNLSRPDEANTWSPPKLWATVVDRSDNPDGPVNRRTAHVIVAVCIVLAMLSLAVIARWRAHSRRWLTALSLTLLLLVAVQMWLGILLLFDGHGVKSGQPFYRFRPASESAAVMPK